MYRYQQQHKIHSAVLQGRLYFFFNNGRIVYCEFHYEEIMPLEETVFFIVAILYQNFRYEVWVLFVVLLLNQCL